MLRAYGPGCEGSLVDATIAKIPQQATWIDLEQPTSEEEQLVERCLGLDVPTHDELAEIEPSSRLYARNGALYMTISEIHGISDGNPATSPIGFVLAGNRLVTVRYAMSKPLRAFIGRAQKEPDLVGDAHRVLAHLLDSIIARLADELEQLGEEIERISLHIFHGKMDERRIPAKRLTHLLTRIGKAQALLAKIRLSAATTTRMLSFLINSKPVAEASADVRRHLSSLETDVTSLAEHAHFLSDNLIFLLDASLGLISIEQNAAMKVFSWVAVVLMPPTLLAGIWGMNFEHMPELGSRYGYILAWTLILLSAIVPFAILKKMRWI